MSNGVYLQLSVLAVVQRDRAEDETLTPWNWLRICYDTLHSIP